MPKVSLASRQDTCAVTGRLIFPKFQGSCRFDKNSHVDTGIRMFLELSVPQFRLRSQQDTFILY